MAPHSDLTPAFFSLAERRFESIEKGVAQRPRATRHPDNHLSEAENVVLSLFRFPPRPLKNTLSIDHERDPGGWGMGSKTSEDQEFLHNGDSNADVACTIGGRRWDMSKGKQVVCVRQMAV